MRLRQRVAAGKKAGPVRQLLPYDRGESLRKDVGACLLALGRWLLLGGLATRLVCLGPFGARRACGLRWGCTSQTMGAAVEGR